MPYSNPQERAPTAADPAAAGSDDPVIAYMSCPQDAAQRYCGALLIADSRGRPIEFSYVEPVAVSAFQRILYGPTLKEHVLVDVIAKKLLGNIQHRPEVLFVNAPDLLAVQRVFSRPVAKLSKTSATGPDAASLSPITFEPASPAQHQDVVAQIVGSLESAFDLVEPFERIHQALRAIPNNT